MPAIELDQDAQRADDDDYVADKYSEVQDSIQDGMDALARRGHCRCSDDNDAIAQSNPTLPSVAQTGFSIGSLTIHRGCGGDTAM